MSRIAALLSFALLLGACGTSKNMTSGVSPNRIDVSELSYPTEVVSAYDIVRQYRANWLRKRGRSSIQNPTPVKVYLDSEGSAYGTVESLRSINGRDIAVIEYYNAGEAQLKFGLGNASGAILVRTFDEDE
jgi:hypothetical protein